MLLHLCPGAFLHRGDGADGGGAAVARTRWAIDECSHDISFSWTLAGFPLYLLTLFNDFEKY